MANAEEVQKPHNKRRRFGKHARGKTPPRRGHAPKRHFELGIFQ